MTLVIVISALIQSIINFHYYIQVKSKPHGKHHEIHKTSHTAKEKVKPDWIFF